MNNQFIKNEVEKIYSNLFGGYFIEIYDSSDNDISPTQFLEEKYWNGTILSNKKNYILNRKCNVGNFDFDFENLYKLNVYGDNNVLNKIKNFDKSNLIHFAYINCDQSIEIAKAFLKGCYEKAMETDPNAGHWATQVIFLAIDTRGKNTQELIKLGNRYFLKEFIYDNLLIFKHEVIL